MQPQVLIVMGSDSDLPVMSQAASFLDSIDVPYSLTIVSAHRTPQRLVTFAENAVAEGFKVIIAGAGGAAHLPGMIASFTPLPVIGVPIKSANLSGLDSLYSIVQMPPGVPVASMAINGALNAGIMAAQILGTFLPHVATQVAAYKQNLNNQVLHKAHKLENQGHSVYLKEYIK